MANRLTTIGRQGPAGPDGKDGGTQPLQPHSITAEMFAENVLDTLRAEIIDDESTSATGVLSAEEVIRRDSLVAAGAINIRVEGATGDGTTDDLTAFNAALSTAQTLGYKTVMVPPGTYRLTAAPTYPSGISLVGLGNPKNTIIKYDFVSSAAAVTSLWNADTFIDGITFQDNSAAPTVLTFDRKFYARHFGVKANGVADDTVPLQNLINASAGKGTAVLPSGTINMPGQLVGLSDMTLVHYGPPERCVLNFTFSGPARDMMKITSKSNVVMEGFTMNANQSITLTNGNCLDINGSNNVIMRRLHLLNAPDDGLDINNSTNISFLEGKVNGSQGSGIFIHGGSSRIHVKYSDLSSNLAFGCFGDNANHLFLNYNYCTVSGLELIGLRYNCLYGEVIGNNPEGTGDNGISVTGKFFTVANNVCKANLGNGIGIFGSYNTVTGNVCFDNNSSNQSARFYGGIALISEFGGEGCFNTVVGNLCFDTQASPTQLCGIWFTPSRYTAWQASVSVAGNSYRTYGNNCYVTTSASGTTGTTPPTHTSGTVSDGGMSWTYVFTSAYNFQPSRNVIGPNVYDRNVLGNYVIGTTGQNFFHDSDNFVAGKEIGTRWTAGGSFTFGQHVIYTSSGVTRLYRSVTGGTAVAGATPPTHTSGSVSDGTISWRYIASTPLLDLISTDESGVSFRGYIKLKSLQQTSDVYIASSSANPLGVVVAPPGSFYLQVGISGIDRFLWYKLSGNDASGWVRVQMQVSGNTASRPAYSGSSYNGLQYFDTTLGKPIWYLNTAGTGWIDATGAAV